MTQDQGAARSESHTAGAKEVNAGNTDKPARAGKGASSGGFDWWRFWIRSLIAIVIFNIIAGLVTWYLIFPRLHPAH